jgi:hypothetical protein
MNNQLLADYFFISSNGDLFDTRKAGWPREALRKGYKFLYSDIETLSQVKACLRHGAFSEMGGYPVYFITSDNCALSFEAVESEFYQVCWDFINDASTGWRIVACGVNNEDDWLLCEHSGKSIPCAYGGD